MSSNQVTDDSLEPGQIEFYSACYPPVQSGNYRLVVDQTLKNIKGEKTDPAFNRNQELVLSSPRFTLDASTVQMVYPPANAEGNFLQTLPNIVLTRRTLPWERAIDPVNIGNQSSAEIDASQDHMPWLTLLTLYEAELNGLKPKQMTVAELLNPSDSSVLPPNLGNTVTDEEKKTLCLTIDVDISLFESIAPKAEELGYLNHVREVNTDGKEVLGIDEQGWYSVSVGNRMSKPGSKNSVYLISLEGHKSHLPEGGGDLSGYSKIRFAMLASWSFIAEQTPGDFIGLLQALPDRGGIELMQMPNRTQQSGDVPAKVNEILKIGYTTLDFQLRDGEQSNAWYRGPMVAAPTQRETSISYSTSDQAIRYDQISGLFDLSYAAAWQIGRLLGLSDATFAKQYFDWRIASYTQMDAASESLVVAKHLGSTVPLDASLEPRQSIDKGAAQFLSKSMVNVAADIPTVSSKQKATKSSALPGVLSDKEIDQQIASGRPTVLALKPNVTDLTE